MFRKIKEFHRKTMEQYQKDLEEKMEPWKKRIMLIHERAKFLFYVDEIETYQDSMECKVKGDLVKETYSVGSRIVFLSGQGKALMRGIMLSEPEEKEEGRQGMIHHKRNEFQVRIDSIEGKKVENLDFGDFEQRLHKVQWDLSLIVEEGL